MDYMSLAAAIVDWMRAYLDRAGMDGYVVGLSGGVDSAAVAALAVHAVGDERTLGVLLPCHSQPEDAAYAQLVASTLGLETQTVDLTAAYDAFVAAMPQGCELAYANVKPRLRMTALYYIAQSNNCLVTGTGNRPEMMVGYFTKYGDGGVDIEPLGELYKHEVRGLARALNVPAAIIARPPTAGLWPGQTDEAELGITYDELDAILCAMETETTIPASEAIQARVREMVATSAHKRALPPTFPIQRDLHRHG